MHIRRLNKLFFLRGFHSRRQRNGIKKQVDQMH